MKRDRIKAIVKRVLDDFFPTNGSDDREFMVSNMDDEDKELLSDALADVLERG